MYALVGLEAALTVGPEAYISTTTFHVGGSAYLWMCGTDIHVRRFFVVELNDSASRTMICLSPGYERSLIVVVTFMAQSRLQCAVARTRGLGIVGRFRWLIANYVNIRTGDHFTCRSLGILVPPTVFFAMQPSCFFPNATIQ